MSQKLADTFVKGLPVPERGNRITYDSEIAGFGCRVTARGARSFVLNYRTKGGRERRLTIGQFPAWKTAAARAEASELKKRIDRGEDPLADAETARDAKTVDDLCERFVEEYLPKKRASTARDYRRAIDNDIRPAMKHLKVAEVSFSDIDALHRKITKRGAPYGANRTVALLSKMFAQAIRWGWRTDNPARGVERNDEQKRQRYLMPAELAALTMALAAHPDQQAANIVRLLLLTGARKTEVLSMRWANVNLAAGVWVKPGAATKQKTEHRVPLAAAAMLLLSGLRAKADGDAEFIFPGRAGSHRVEFKRTWAQLCATAGITARVHDLRHTYASVLASAGMSLPIIGALLGHTQQATTARYAHLLDDPLRAATNRAAAIVGGQPSAEIVPLTDARTGARGGGS